MLGSIHVNLSVLSDCEDTAFSAKIMEVMEDGKAYNIRTGITTLEYGASDKGAYACNEGTAADITIKMWDVAWKFKKGSRIRIDISSSDFPQYAAHSNQKGCWAEIKENKIAHQKILVGDGRSYVSIPLI